MTSLPTGSSVGVSIICTGKRNLPVVRTDGNERMQRGTDVHAFLEATYHANGGPVALPSHPETAAFCASLDTASIIPKGMVSAETAYAYHIGTGGCRVLGDGLERQYVVEPGLEVPATADCVFARDGVLGVADYKITDSDLWAPPPQKSGQLKFLGMCVMKIHGVDRVILQTIRVSGSGKPHVDEWIMDQFECDAFEKTLQYSLTAPPILLEGPHCQACNSFQVCPAKISMMRGAIAESHEAAMSLEINEDNAPKLVQRLEDLEDLLKFYQKELKEYAKDFPIEMPNGDIYGPVRRTYRSINDYQKAQEILTREYGGKCVNVLKVEESMPLSNLAEALGQRESEEAIKKLDKAGLISVKVTNNVGLNRKPRKALK